MSDETWPWYALQAKQTHARHRERQSVLSTAKGPTDCVERPFQWAATHTTGALVQLMLILHLDAFIFAILELWTKRRHKTLTFPTWWCLCGQCTAMPVGGPGRWLQIWSSEGQGLLWVTQSPQNTQGKPWSSQASNCRACEVTPVHQMSINVFTGVVERMSLGRLRAIPFGFYDV